MKNKSDVEAMFVQMGLTRLLKDLDRLMQPSIRLHATPTEESSLQIGSSKIGGLPDLPSDIPWPQWSGRAQSFVVQLRFEELQSDNTARHLPTQGMLWLFYDARQETYGENPTDKDGWHVIFRTEIGTLQRVQPPTNLPTSSIFRPCTLSFAQEITLSHAPQFDIPNYDWTSTEQAQYEKLLATFPNPDDHATIHHRLLGFPDTIQDDMRVQCQLVSHGITDEEDARAATLLPEAHNWQLLLQIDSDERINMRWADAGMLYYWLRETDLQARQFDTGWLILQSD